MHLRRGSIASGRRSCVALVGLAIASIAQAQVIGWGDSTYSACTPPQRSVIGFRQVAAGQDHTVVLRRDGSVAAWGSNWYGQTAVPSGLSNVVQVAGGTYFTLAVRGDGTVVAWGDNPYGECDVPVGLNDVVQVDGGSTHAVALRATGAVRCWGYNVSGQCSVPNGLSSVRSVSAGANHTMALRVDGTVALWGDNRYGQSAPCTSSGLVQISAGDVHSMALASDGHVLCWGGFTQPAGVSGVRQIAATSWGAYTLSTAGTLTCWGYNLHGRFSPPPGLSGVVAIAAGKLYHAAALMSDGRVVCWGDNDFGECNVPVSGHRLSQVSAGGIHTMGLRDDGTVICWGDTYNGQCAVPAGLSNVVQISAGRFHSAARRANGTLALWGSNDDGECNPPANLGPVMHVAAGAFDTVVVMTDGTVRAWGNDNFGQADPPTGLSGVVEVAAAWHSIARSLSGAVVCWGRDGNQQCQPPSGLSNVRQVSAGTDHSAALCSDGTVKCWGRNQAGQCSVPTGLTGVEQVDAGETHTVALRSDGTVAAWGSNDYGPVQPPTGLSKVTQVSAGIYHSVALLDQQVGGCSSAGGAGTATLASSGGSWQDVNVWSWSLGGPRVPGVQSLVDLGESGSVASECGASAFTFAAHAGSTLLITDAAMQPGNDVSVHVSDGAALAGRLWLVSGSGGTLPANLDVPVISASQMVGTFDVLQSDVAAPAGKFLTLVPSSVGNSTLLSLRLLDLPGSSSGLTGTGTATAAGRAVAAQVIDLNHDGFDDLALAIDFGASVPGAVQVLMNDGTGQLGSTSVIAQSPPQPTCLAVGDVSGDGKADIVIGTALESALRVFRDNGFGGLAPVQQVGQLSGTATAVGTLPSGSPSAPADLIAVATTTNVLQLLSGTGGAIQTLALAGRASAVRACVVSVPLEMRGGGTRRGSDIATAGATSSSVDGLMPTPGGFLQVVRQTPTSGYAVQQTLTVPGRPVDLDVGDLDGDGLDEIVTANADPVSGGPGSALPVLSLFRNTVGTLGGGVSLQPSGASEGLGVALVDAAGDGQRSIVSVHATVGASSEASVLDVRTLGPGTPLTISESGAIDGNHPTLVTRGNLDGQNGEDVVLVDAPTQNQLVGSSVARPFVATPVARLGDLDGSGEVDLGDVALCLLDYGPCPGCPSDVDGSGEVDFGDIALIMLNFG